MKTFIRVLSLCVGVLFILTATAYFYRNQLIVTSIETFLPQMTKTKVSVQKVDFRPFSGQIEINGLKIGNPKGFSAPDVFSLNRIFVKVNTASLLTKKILVDNVLIDGVAAVYEISNGQSNISVIKNNVSPDTASPATATASASASAKTDKESKHVIIKKFLLKNAQVSGIVGGIRIDLPLPRLSLTNIGESTPATVEQAVSQIVAAFSKEITNAIQNSGGNILKAGEKSLNKLIKKLF